jgi:hypothetical protein
MTNHLPGGKPESAAKTPHGPVEEIDSGQRAAGYVNGCSRARRLPAAPRCQQDKPSRAGNGPGERTWIGKDNPARARYGSGELTVGVAWGLAR